MTSNATPGDILVNTLVDTHADIEFPADSELAYALGAPALSATIKQELTDFKVDEELGFDCTGSGEHLYLRVCKRDLSTPDVARRLQAMTQVPLSAIGYAGMKDRRGECTQWFSVQLPREMQQKLLQGLQQNAQQLDDDKLSILETRRNGRKLKIGSHKLNHFELRLRDCIGAPEQFEQRLHDMQQLGLPNYFGPQRFGHEMSNLTQAQDLFRRVLSEQASEQATRKASEQHIKRGMLFSAARGWLFNQVLSRRVAAGNWNVYVAGDVLNLAGTDRCFAVQAEAWDALLQQRLQEFDIHLTGPLAGAVAAKDKYISHGKAADIEDAVLRQFPTLVQGLARCGLTAARRPLRFVPLGLQWEWEDATTLNLRFALSRGCYATSLLRELCNINSSKR